MFKTQNADQFGDIISRLWSFVFFVMIFRDLHEMATASTIRGILTGTYEGNPVTNTGLVAGGVALVMMLATMVLSSMLVPALAKRLNLIIAPLAIAGLFVLPPNDPDDYLLASVTGFSLVLIFWLCWTWKINSAHSAKGMVHYAT